MSFRWQRRETKGQNVFMDLTSGRSKRIKPKGLRRRVYFQVPDIWPQRYDTL